LAGKEVNGVVDSRMSADLLRGHTDTIILKLLLSGDKYGYEICKLVHAGSNGEYELKEATMYSSMKRLELEGGVVSYWGDESHGGRRKYYRITDKGKLMYAENKSNWEFAKRILDHFM
jgi:PadR family transcriptional regulator PadR